jgi:hypothetical protein
MPAVDKVKFGRKEIKNVNVSPSPLRLEKRLLPELECRVVSAKNEFGEEFLLSIAGGVRDESIN